MKLAYDERPPRGTPEGAAAGSMYCVQSVRAPGAHPTEVRGTPRASGRAGVTSAVGCQRACIFVGRMKANRPSAYIFYLNILRGSGGSKAVGR